MDHEQKRDPVKRIAVKKPAQRGENPIEKSPINSKLLFTAG
jgi:hypothetical protein